METSKEKSTALAVYAIGAGKSRCELRPLLESANYLNVIYAEKMNNNGDLTWEFKGLIERTSEDKDANTKNELVRGKTDIITKSIYRMKSTRGDKISTQWIDENEMIIAHGYGGKRTKITAAGRQSETSTAHVQPLDWSLATEKSMNRKGRSSQAFDNVDDEEMITSGLLMPTLTVVKPLDGNKME